MTALKCRLLSHGKRVLIATVDGPWGRSTIFRKPVAYLLVVAYLANLGCTNMPFPIPGVLKELGRDVGMRQLAAIWKDDIPIARTEHTFYPTVERLPGEEFIPTTLPLASMDDATPIEPGDYEIPAYFYCAHVYTRNGSGYPYRLAKLQGKFAQALTQVYVRASKARTPTSDVQVLSWSLEAGVAYEDLGSQQRALVDHLIPEYRAQMQLGLTEKVMRDWNTWSSRLPVPSFNNALAKMGDVGSYIQTLMRARQEIINKNYNYHALSSVFVIPYDAPVPIEREKSAWSRIDDRIYMRVIAPKGALNDGVIQVRILDGHSRNQQEPNAPSVTGGAPESWGEVTVADSPVPDDLTPAILAQIAPPVTRPLSPSQAVSSIIPPSDIAIPATGPIPAGILRGCQEVR